MVLIEQKAATAPKSGSDNPLQPYFLPLPAVFCTNKLRKILMREIGYYHLSIFLYALYFYRTLSEPHAVGIH
jgi:hypothetical protein